MIYNHDTLLQRLKNTQTKTHTHTKRPQVWIMKLIKPETLLFWTTKMHATTHAAFNPVARTRSRQAALAFDNIPSWKAEDDAFWDLLSEKSTEFLLDLTEFPFYEIHFFVLLVGANRVVFDSIDPSNAFVETTGFAASVQGHACCHLGHTTKSNDGQGLVHPTSFKGGAKWQSSVRYFGTWLQKVASISRKALIQSHFLWLAPWLAENHRGFHFNFSLCHRTRSCVGISFWVLFLASQSWFAFLLPLTFPAAIAQIRRPVATCYLRSLSSAA